ncbi:hypothetical protein PAPYR_12436 [Paratrimastix pyriformis]|uniref:Uncharacterized protein n=1 Tax=Paratrimastix pyriformis TaxID=342808 RepID=A0ABQ8U5R8_9EUKA|nr:hypothetical protein PAPYR_12436 [Paratrimastix pyriformis]
MMARSPVCGFGLGSGLSRTHGQNENLTASFSRSSQGLVIRICFAIANLIAANELARHRFGEAGAVTVLCDLLSRCADTFLDSLTHPPAATPVAAPAPTTSALSGGLLDARPRGGPGFADDSSPGDVLVKVVRVLANLAINPQLGRQLAGSDVVLHTVCRLLEDCPVERHEELVLNLTALASNLSYHQCPENRFLSPGPRLASPRVYANLCRIETHRTMLRAMKVLDMCMLLLMHSDPEGARGRCGDRDQLRPGSGLFGQRGVLTRSVAITLLPEQIAGVPLAQYCDGSNPQATR